MKTGFDFCTTSEIDRGGDPTLPIRRNSATQIVDLAKA
jgi:hypothetical protein